MDIISMAKLKSFSGRYPDWCVSLFMPTHRRGRETEQDPIRFRNLLDQVDVRLQSKGVRSSDGREMLKPARRLLKDQAFWRHQSDGLAVFVNSEECRVYRLPLSFEELVVISDCFHVKPLLPLFTSDGHFYILALSQNQVRLLEGTRQTVDEVDLGDMPKSMAEAFQYESFERQLQFHTGTSGGSGKRAAMFHGHDAREEEKERILKWFRTIDEELAVLFAGDESPIVPAGVEFLFPIFKEATSYPHRVVEGIRGNPEELKPEELHALAWPILEPIFSKSREKAVSRYRQLAGTGQTTTDVKEAVLAAYHGQVDVLFVAVGVQVWGYFDPDANTVYVNGDLKPGDQDLLDAAAVQSILNGGTVYAVEPEHVPDRAPIAAVLRY
ncbi:MAG TPA: hypothetical protein ENN79_00990 [Desulfobacteraceae bacterium]|nr:hypothetical protein [Desulfobacteraceae bacterium]